MIDSGNEDINVDTLMEEVRAEVARRDTNGAGLRPSQKLSTPPVEYRVNERRFASADQLLRLALQLSQPRTTWPKSARKAPIAVPEKLRSSVLRVFSYLFKDQRNFNNTIVAGSREILALQLENTETVRDLVKKVAALQGVIEANYATFTANEARFEEFARELDRLRGTAPARDAVAELEHSIHASMAANRAELEQLGAVVAAMRSDSERTSSEIERSENAIVTMIAANRAQIDRLETSLTALRNLANDHSLSDRVDGLAATVEAMLDDLYALAADATLRSDLEAVSSQIASLATEVRDSIEYLAAFRATDAEPQTSEFATRLEALELGLRETTANLFDIHEHVQHIPTHGFLLGELQEQLPEFVRRVRVLEQTAIARDEITELYPAVRALREMIEYIPIHQELIERLESTSLRPTSADDELTGRVEQLALAQQRIESETAALTTRMAERADLNTMVEMSAMTLKDLTNRLAQHDAELGELRQEFPELWNEIETSKAATNAHLAELREKAASSVNRADLEALGLSMDALKLMSDRIAIHGTVLAELRESLPTITARVDALDAGVEERDVAAKLVQLDTYVAALRAELDEVKPFGAQSESLAETIADLTRKSESLQSELSAAIASIDRRFHHIEFRSATYDQRLAFIEPRLSSHDDRLSQGRMIDEALGKGIEKLAAIEPRLEVHEAEIAKIAALAERTATSQAAEKAGPHTFVPAQVEDEILVKFADVFRGPEALITERLRTYLPRLDQMGLTPASKIVDLGSGRGEWLRLLTERNLSPIGVDTSAILAERCNAHGLCVERADALTYLRSLRDRSVSLFTAFHLVEHLPFSYLEQLIAEISRALAPSGMVILETPNPENVLTGACNFYLDPTHRNPIPSPLLKFQCENHGLRSIEVLNMHPNTEAQIPGTTLLSERFNALFYGAMDYAIVARSPVMKAVG